jgi:hypothetical protein
MDAAKPRLASAFKPQGDIYAAAGVVPGALVEAASLKA